jgi:hypothetical protein
MFPHTQRVMNGALTAPATVTQVTLQVPFLVRSQKDEDLCSERTTRLVWPDGIGHLVGLPVQAASPDDKQQQP